MKNAQLSYNKRPKNLLNVSGDHNVRKKVQEISTNAMETPTCNIHSIFITICCNQ